jgi:hypothetical protein
MDSASAANQACYNRFSDEMHQRWAAAGVGLSRWAQWGRQSRKSQWVTHNEGTTSG